MPKCRIVWLGVLALCALSLTAFAEQINFTGGTATMWDGSTAVTNNSNTYQSVANYVEGNYQATFIGNRTTSFESIIGNYEGAGNDVIHGHWATGDYGGLTKIIFTRLDGASFDLNYFILTSNTDTGGGAASGNERTFIYASEDGTTASFSMLLPPDDWGWPGHNIFLGPEFDNVKAFWFQTENAVDCFGMDSFYINEPAPPVPEPATLLLVATGAGAILTRRFKNLLHR